MLHGGDLTEAMAQYGGERSAWLDLSTGINPHSWAMPEIEPRLWKALPNKADEAALLLAARDAYSVPSGAGIVAAPGTQALIQWLPHLAPAGDVQVLGPTYGEHAKSWAQAGRHVSEITALNNASDRHLVVVNPNNPDGRWLPFAAVEELGEVAAQRGGWLVVDESFVDVEPHQTVAHLVERLPIIILRSFGKFYGLAGVRLGFAIAAPGIKQRLESALGPWPVAGPALALGRMALRDQSWAEAMRVQLHGESQQLDAVLRAVGGEVVGGTVLYRLLRHAHANALHGHLAAHRIWVRRFDWDDGLLRFGLPGRPACLARLAAALSAFAAHQVSPQGEIRVSPSTS